jgi:hypothetical protein
MSMIRGTTPLLEFTVPFDTRQLAEAYVTLAQSGKVVVDKKLEDCEVDTHKLSVRLTQEETLRLDDGYVTEIQIRVRTIEGEALASNIIAERTDRILKDGVI